MATVCKYPAGTSSEGAADDPDSPCLGLMAFQCLSMFNMVTRQLHSVPTLICSSNGL